MWLVVGLIAQPLLLWYGWEVDGLRGLIVILAGMSLLKRAERWSGFDLYRQEFEDLFRLLEQRAQMIDDIAPSADFRKNNESPAWDEHVRKVRTHLLGREKRR